MWILECFKILVPGSVLAYVFLLSFVFGVLFKLIRR